MFELVKKIFTGLLISPANASNQTKCVSLSKKKCMIQLTLINLHPNEYNQEYHCYPCVVKLDKCVGGCNTLNDLSNLSKCYPNKTEDLNLRVVNMIIGINKCKTLTKHISCECKCRFDCNQINGRIIVNVDMSVNNTMFVRKIRFGILGLETSNCENGKYLASIMEIQ